MNWRDGQWDVGSRFHGWIGGRRFVVDGLVDGLLAGHRSFSGSQNSSASGLSGVCGVPGCRPCDGLWPLANLRLNSPHSDTYVIYGIYGTAVRRACGLAVALSSRARQLLDL